MIWWPSGSGDREIGDLSFNENSVVFMEILWSGGLLVVATDESATECLVNDRGVALM